MKKLFQKKGTASVSMDNIYQLDGRVPVHRAIPFGFQHILAMFVANIAPILIVSGACGLTVQDTARLIQTAMIIAGIGTLTSFSRFGVSVPVCPSSWVSALRSFPSFVTLDRDMDIPR